MFPQVLGTILGVPIRDYSVLGLTLGSHYVGKLPYMSIRHMVGSEQGFQGDIWQR